MFPMRAGEQGVADGGLAAGSTYHVKVYLPMLCASEATKRASLLMVLEMSRERAKAEGWLGRSGAADDAGDCARQARSGG
jgi:hypothetical protein